MKRLGETAECQLPFRGKLNNSMFPSEENPQDIQLCLTIPVFSKNLRKSHKTHALAVNDPPTHTLVVNDPHNTYLGSQ